jgi:hypothetical protein
MGLFAGFLAESYDIGSFLVASVEPRVVPYGLRVSKRGIRQAQSDRRQEFSPVGTAFPVRS